MDQKIKTKFKLPDALLAYVALVYFKNLSKLSLFPYKCLDSDLNADNIRLGSDVVLHVHHFLCDGIVVAVITVKNGIIYRVEIYKKAGCVSRVW